MEKEEIIRAYMLEPGDIFKVGLTRYRVRAIENDRIIYERFRISGGKNRFESMGANSQERLILITNKTKQNEHQN